jgi:hypothetical protein
VATIWAGASAGTSTLDDSRTAARKALAGENARYPIYRATRSAVLSAFADVDWHSARFTAADTFLAEPERGS